MLLAAAAHKATGKQWEAPAMTTSLVAVMVAAAGKIRMQAEQAEYQAAAAVVGGQPLVTTSRAAWVQKVKSVCGCTEI